MMASIVMLIICIFIVDLGVPLGFAGGVPYAAVVTLTLWMPGITPALVVASAASVLTMFGWYFSPDGGEVWAVTANRLVAFGIIWCISVAVLHQKKSQEALRARKEEYRGLFHESVAPIFTFDTAMNFVDTNQAGIDLLGYTRAELLQMGIPDVDADPNAVRPAQQQVFGGGRIIGLEHELRCKDGKIITVLNNSRPLIDLSGNVTGVQSTLMDITERKQAEAEQARLQRELQKAQKMEAMGQLTGGIAHDFNNILGIMLGYTELALSRCVQGSQTELTKYLNQVEKAGLRAKNLVAQMLASTRGEAGSDNQLYLQPLVEENLKMIRATLPTSIEISTEIDESLPTVATDPVQISRLLMNLLINARDAMEGKGAINVRLDWAREVGAECAICHKPVEGDWVGLSIEDTGNGISKDVLDCMFDPFFTTKDVGKGTGLGLSVVSGIMRSHEGHLLVETEQGKGTAFRLLFPPAAKELDKTQTTAGATADRPSGHGEQILVVDDEPGLGAIIGENLESNNFRATVLTSSREALELFEQRPDEFALLITDQTMPGITGMELVKAMRRVRPDMPAILNTGFSDQVNADEAAKMSVRYMEKPVKIEDLVVTIGELLQPAERRTE